MPEIVHFTSRLVLVDLVIGKMVLLAASFMAYLCRCSKFHPLCEESTTMLIPNMFASLGFMEMMLDERDSDVGLEVSDTTTLFHTIRFYLGFV